jgi:dTDP-glucose 4,6-dehydratase
MSKNTRVLLTGGAGFIGHHFVEGLLRETDYDIVILDGLNYAGDPNRLTNISCWEQEKHRVNFVWWDLRSELTYSIEKEIGEVDYVIHLAAESHVDRSITNAKPFFMANVIGTLHLLEWARLHPVKKFIYFSTDEVYGPIMEGGWKEDARHASGNPYSASKAAAEDLCLSYANTYKLPIVITNTMNVFGERQHPEKFIPLVISKVLNGETITIHSDPTKTKAGSRFYIHARNALKAILFILNQTTETIEVKEPAMGRFNIVGEKEVDNLQLAQFIADKIGKPLKYEMVDFHSSRPGHDLRYGLDGGKLKAMGFEYPSTFEETLTKTITWYLNNPKWLKD